jgi:hypothetical protein
LEENDEVKRMKRWLYRSRTAPGLKPIFGRGADSPV